MVKRKYSSKRSTKSKIKRRLKRPIKLMLKRLSKRSAKNKEIYGKFKFWMSRKKFDKYSKCEVDKKLVVFEVFLGQKYTDSPKAIYEYMLKSPEYSDYNFIWCFKDRCMDEYIHIEKNDRTKLLLWGSPEYYKAYATAGYWITNYRLNTAFSIKKDQVYLQCWHGTPLKRLGFDIDVEAEDARITIKRRTTVYEADAKRYTYMLSPSRYSSEKFKSAFNLEALGKADIMIEEGYPRNDFIAKHDKSDVDRIRQELGIPEDKKVILYAPTWRENQHQEDVGYVYDMPIDFRTLREALGDEYVILFRAHYFIASKYDYAEFDGFVLDVSSYSEVNDLYIISDILVTDYSSVFFDYSILRRPVIFYMYDLDYYANCSNGFYLTLDDLPGPVVKTQEELEGKLNTVLEWTKDEEYKRKYRSFNDKFTYLDDGNATERVVKRIFGR